MPRVIVTSDTSRIPSDTSILLDEQVSAVHLASGHSAAQLIERLAWAINDAEEHERSPATLAPAERPRGQVRRRGHSPSARSRAAA